MDSIKYISNRNRKFVPKPRGNIAPKAEVVRNIAIKAERFNSPTESMGCGGFVAFLLGLLFIFGGVCSLPVTFKFLYTLATEGYQSGLIIPLLLFLSMNILLTPQGYLTLEHFFLILRYPSANKSYGDLLINGTRLEGKLVEVQKAKRPRHRNLIYQFTSPQGILMQGSHITASKKDFQAGDQVAVLYYDEYMNILL